MLPQNALNIIFFQEFFEKKIFSKTQNRGGPTLKILQEPRLRNAKKKKKKNPRRPDFRRGDPKNLAASEVATPARPSKFCLFENEMLPRNALNITFFQEFKKKKFFPQIQIKGGPRPKILQDWRQRPARDLRNFVFFKTRSCPGML